MNTRILLIGLASLMSATCTSRSQGTFVYDQQSFDHAIPPNLTYSIQPYQPMGQSFVPALSSIAFVQLDLFDGLPGNGMGATIYVDLLQDSITGTVLSSTAGVSMPDNFGGVANFFFPSSVALTSGTTYYLQPVV